LEEKIGAYYVLRRLVFWELEEMLNRFWTQQ